MSKRYSGALITKTPVVPTSLSAPGIWSLSDQAAAQATNTWPFPRDPQFKNVTMLLHGDGSAGPVAATGVGAGVSTTVTNFNADASTNNFNVTINGDARSDNFTPYQAGYYSNYFDGSGDYLTVPNNAALNVGSSAFTIECWFYNQQNRLSGAEAGVGTIFGKSDYNGSTTNGYTLFCYDGNNSTPSTNLRFFLNGVTFFVTTPAGAVPFNTWTHIAVVKSGTNLTIYCNGVSSVTSSSAPSTVNDTSTVFISGSQINGTTWNGTYPLSGLVSNLRLVKGTAVYTAAFTPPTAPLTAITNTSLLTCQSNRFIDNSTNAFTITKAGDTAVSPAQPFTLPSSVATYGSGYFDGTGDSLNAPASSAQFSPGTSNLTVEGWYYFTNLSAGVTNLFGCNNGSGSTQKLVAYIEANGTIHFDLTQAGGASQATSASGAVVNNTWYHLAFVRNSSTATIYVNGTSVASGSATGNLSALTNPFYIGYVGEAYGVLMSGYVSDFRYVNGTAVYTTTFTPPTSPLTAITNTKLLTTQYNGGGNNSGFKDSSQFNFPITRNGNTTQGTFTPYGSNWSTSFNGSSDYLTTPQTTSLNIGTGTFTVEAFVYLNSKYSSGGTSIINLGNGANGGGPYTGWGLIIDYDAGSSTAYPAWYRYDGSVTQYTSSTSLNIGQWYHLAVARDSSNNIAIWVNGTRVFSGTSTVTYNNVNSDPLNIGRRTNGSANSPNWLNGYISNGRVVIGSNVYDPTQSTITVPTTPLTAVTNTQLLVLQSNRFVDNSSAARAITVAGGSPSVQRFSPFAPLTVYNPTTYGGSAYFDGSGDYLNLASNSAFNIGTNSFCIEFWVYTSSFPSGLTAVGLVSASYNTNVHILGFNTTGIRFYIVNSYVDSTTAINLNAWNHVACVRNGTTATVYINGVASGTGTLSGTGANSALYIGTSSHATGETMTGYLSNVRFVNGSAVYTSNFTPNAPLTAIANTSFLLSGTNPAILDNSMLNNLETVGNAAVSTSVKKYGAASMYFDGTDDRLNMPSSPNLAFGTGDFTLEMWAYFTSVASFPTLTDSRSSTGSTAGFNLGLSTAKVQLYTTSQLLIGSSTLSTNTWYHIAVTRASGTLKIWLNGVQDATVANSTNWSDQTFVVGATPSAANFMTGYIDDLRITKGVARYTATFTVPDQAFPNG